MTYEKPKGGPLGTPPSAGYVSAGPEVPSPPLPPGVSYTWERLSRRQAELVVRYDGRVIFHAMTDGRKWSPEDVCELLWAQRETGG